MWFSFSINFMHFTDWMSYPRAFFAKEKKRAKGSKLILWDLLTKRQEMAGYGDMDSQRVLPIAPIRNQFSVEQPTSYMSLLG